MARIIVVTSGKGGVGKTTSSASFSTGLALRGHKTAVIDFDVGLRNLDLIMGCERRVVYDFVNVIHGEATLNQALIKDKHNEHLSVLAASQTRDKEALSKDGVEKVLNDLAGMGFEYIVCDSPAGIGPVRSGHAFDDEALVSPTRRLSRCATPTHPRQLASKTSARSMQEPIKETPYLTATTTSRVDRATCVGRTSGHPAHPLIGVVPESESYAGQQPGTPGAPKGTDVSEAYQDVVARLLGEERPLLSSIREGGF